MKTSPARLLPMLSLLLVAASAQALDVRVYGRTGLLYESDSAVRAPEETAESFTDRTVGQSLKIGKDAYGVIAIGDLKQDTSQPNRVEGWCYEVDGQLPGQGFRDLELSPANQRLTWFFGYAEKSASGEWSCCVPFVAH